MKENKKRSLRQKRADKDSFAPGYLAVNNRGKDPTSYPDMISEANRIIDETLKLYLKKPNDRKYKDVLFTIAYISLPVVLIVCVIITVGAL